MVTISRRLQRHVTAKPLRGAKAGLHPFWRLPAGVPDAAVLEVLARRVRVGVHTLASGAQRRFICRGCYFIYEEARGLPAQSIAPGTPFAEISGHWKCPDCGTDKTNFRPYVRRPRGAARVVVSIPRG
jgi:rubredoxin